MKPERAKAGSRARAVARGFGAWRASRPFWGGVWSIAAAVELLALTRAQLEVTFVQGLSGVGTLVIAAVLLALAVVSWAQPPLRTVCGVLIVIAGLASFPVSNLGGFLLGMTMALVGGSMIFAWEPPARDAVPDKALDEAEPQSAKPPPRGPDSETANPQAAEARAEPATARPASWLRPRRRLAGTAVFVTITAMSATLTAAPAAASPSTDTSIPWPIPGLPWPDDSGPGSPDDPHDQPESDPENADDDAESGDVAERPPQCRLERFAQAQADPVDTVALAELYAECLDTGFVPASDPSAADVPRAGVTPPVLSAATMTMQGLSYGGVVEVPTADGPVATLEFTMDSMELEDMVNSADVGDAGSLDVINEEDAAVLHGDVRQYVSRIEGKLFGAVPVEFTAQSPPPVTTKTLILTDAVAETAYMRCDEIRLPKLRELTG